MPVGPPLGVGPGRYEPATWRLDPGRTRLLFTSGSSSTVVRTSIALDRLARLG